MTETIYTPSPERYDGAMEYRRCGQSGIKMPAVSLGLWHNFGSISVPDNAKKMMHFAFDNGITCFDLANNYGPAYGTAEETFGLLMDKSFRPYRDEMFITTKAGYDMWPGPYGNWGSRKYLVSSLDQSLKRMHLDYVDLFYTHRFDPETPLDETLQALVDIVRAGKALYVGISRYPNEAALYAYDYLKQRDVPCLCYQGKCNMLYRNDIDNGIISDAEQHGAGYVAFSPLQQGLLTNRYLDGIPADSRMARREALTPEALTPELLKKLHALDGIARERGQSLAGMSLAWLLGQRNIASVIVGASKVAQLKDNLRAISSPTFSEEELRRIQHICSDSVKNPA